MWSKRKVEIETDRGTRRGYGEGGRVKVETEERAERQRRPASKKREKEWEGGVG